MSLPRSRTNDPREILGAERTPLEEILTALAGYTLRPLVKPEENGAKPYARPAEFQEGQILSLQNVGRFYYLCSSLERAQSCSLVTPAGSGADSAAALCGACGGPGGVAAGISCGRAADPQKGEWNMSRDAFFPGLVSVVRIVILWCSAFWLFTMTEYREIYGVALGRFCSLASVRS